MISGFAGSESVIVSMVPKGSENLRLPSSRYALANFNWEHKSGKAGVYFKTFVVITRLPAAIASVTEAAEATTAGPMSSQSFRRFCPPS